MSRAPDADPSPFLSGNFAPVERELSAANLPVHGELPPDLDGLFVRNGPNPQFTPPGRYHWFDGDGMLHGTRIANGRASYRNRYIRTAGFERERAAGRPLWSGLMEPPLQDGAGEPFKNTGNTALVFHQGRFLATWEAGPPHQIRVPGLETAGLYDCGGKLAGPFTAHPKVDAVSGEMMFFGYQPLPPYLTYGVLSRDGELVRSEPIDLAGPVMIHDMAITENHSILLDLPLRFDLARVADGESPLVFDDDSPARFGILPRRGGNADVRWFEAPPCYVFHTTNAWEEGDCVVLLACRMESTDVLQGSGGDADGNRGRLHRWRFDLTSGRVSEEALDDVASDFPRLHDGLMGRRNRYSYNARFAAGPAEVPLFDGLVKYDHEAGTSLHHDHGPGRSGGEAVFAPRAGAIAEDDGFVLGYVHDEREGTDELVVIDARNFDDPPLARVVLPGRVPYGFHAAWLGADQLAAAGS